MLRKPELLIVDIPRELKSLCALLSREGYQTVGVSSGEAGLDAIRASRYPLLITDLHMPQMDGIELIREAHVCDPDIVCIVMTTDRTVQNASRR